MIGTGVGDDYPKWGIWPTAYFQTLNDPTGICAYNSSKLLSGDSSAEQICVALGTNDFILVPGDVDSNLLPPLGQDEFFIGSVGQDPNCIGGTGNCTKLYLYSMHVNSGNPPSATVVGSGLTFPITVPAFSIFCPSGGIYSNCIPQPGTGSPLLEGLGRYAMYRLAYWNDGPGGTQHWFVNHVVSTGAGAGVRWYEFQAPTTLATLSNVSLYQSGTFAPDGNSRWMGSIARDRSGDIALAYSESGSAKFASIYATGQVPGDPLGMMEGEVQLRAGSGINPNSGQNWGDYSSLAMDGADGCTFWYASEYYSNTDSNWHTRLIKFQFAGCTPY
jgi:hypothetical protein